MLEFLTIQNNPDHPSFTSILIAILCSFFLSSLIVFTYQITTRDISRPAHLLQSMSLIAIVAATVMQAIGDSLARGLGMLGALAIIRFRTVLNDPRNMAFMFASIAAGIACGVFGFTIAEKSEAQNFGVLSIFRNLFLANRLVLIVVLNCRI